MALGVAPADTPLTAITDPRVSAFRPYRGYRAINIFETWFHSSYYALQSMFKADIPGGFVTASYNWSKTLINAGSNTATPQDTYDRSLEKVHWNSDSRQRRHSPCRFRMRSQCGLAAHAAAIVQYGLSGGRAKRSDPARKYPSQWYPRSRLSEVGFVAVH